MRCTTPRPKALLAWSSGKDSAWTLQVLRQAGNIDVVGLLTTIEKTARHVSMHETPEELLEAQADAVGLPIWKVEIPWPCPNADYEAAMGQTVQRAQEQGITLTAFGDLFLEDIRAYRVAQMQGTGIEPVFPLWQLDTTQLARTMVESGLRATVTCVDTKQAPADLVGREFSTEFLDDLPETVDPCGERGEFHTFVHDGPMFAHPVNVVAGAVTTVDGFARVALRRA